MKAQFYVNPAHQKWVSQYTDECEIRTVTVASIQVEKSRKDNNRPGPALVAHDIALMRKSIREAVPLPALVLQTDGNGYLVIDGNNRLKALMEEKNTEVQALVVNVPDDEYEQMRLDANMLTGASLTETQRLAHAMEAVLKKGMTQVEASERYGVSRKVISREVTRVKAVNKMKKMGWSTSRPTTAPQAQLVNAVERDVLEKIGPDMAADVAKSGDVAQFIKDVTTTPDIIEVIEVKRAELAEKNGKRTNVDPSKVVRAVRQEAKRVRSHKSLAGNPEVVQAVAHLVQAVTQGNPASVDVMLDAMGLARVEA